MEEKIIELFVSVWKTDELSDVDNRLRISAVEAAKRAYAPYSHFQVGSAVLLEDGTMIEGNNQENIAYPSGLCAERVALFAAGATFPEKLVTALSIASIQDGVVQPAISPCGACRQVMLETEQRYGNQIRILLCGQNETVIVPSAKDLLPLAFTW